MNTISGINIYSFITKSHGLDALPMHFWQQI
jgi:hypothetical protein